MCEGCRYAVPVYMGDGEELMRACVYILRTGRKRPCPPGEGCTVREPAEPGSSADIRRNAVKADVYAHMKCAVRRS